MKQARAIVHALRPVLTRTSAASPWPSCRVSAIAARPRSPAATISSLHRDRHDRARSATALRPRRSPRPTRSADALDEDLRPRATTTRRRDTVRRDRHVHGHVDGRVRHRGEPATTSCTESTSNGRLHQDPVLGHLADDRHAARRWRSQSIVAPPNGSIGADRGSLAVSVKNAPGAGHLGVAIVRHRAGDVQRDHRPQRLHRSSATCRSATTRSTPTLRRAGRPERHSRRPPQTVDVVGRVDDDGRAPVRHPGLDRRRPSACAATAAPGAATSRPTRIIVFNTGMQTAEIFGTAGTTYPRRQRPRRCSRSPRPTPSTPAAARPTTPIPTTIDTPPAAASLAA